VSVVVLSVIELMLTVPVEDWIVFQQIYLLTLVTCKSVTTKRLCCICNIYYFACMKNEDTNGVTANQRTDNDKIEKRQRDTQ